MAADCEHGVSAVWRQALVRRLGDIEAAGLRRRALSCADPQGPFRHVDGRRLLCFASNDYLGLAADARVRRAFVEGVERWGVGAGAAHLLGGHTPAHEALEDALADWTGRGRALLFSTGYMANLGLVAGLVGRHDEVVTDRLNHASLIDAARLAGASHRRYAHGDAEAAARRLAAIAEGSLGLLVTDGVFSMDGDLAPLGELSRRCQGAGALLCVDDAHGLGVLGREGGGSVPALGLDGTDVPVLVGTLGKAVGTFGAFVAGPADLIEVLRHDARSYVFTTAPPPALAEATLEALRIVRNEGHRRSRLVELVERFRRGAAELGLPLSPSKTPIQPVILGTAKRAVAISRRLADAGLWVPAVRPPTVPDGQARLRVTLSASHEPEHVDRLLDGLHGALGREVA